MKNKKQAVTKAAKLKAENFCEKLSLNDNFTRIQSVTDNSGRIINACTNKEGKPEAIGLIFCGISHSKKTGVSVQYVQEGIDKKFTVNNVSSIQMGDMVAQISKSGKIVTLGKFEPPAETRVFSVHKKIPPSKVKHAAQISAVEYGIQNPKPQILRHEFKYEVGEYEIDISFNCDENSAPSDRDAEIAAWLAYIDALKGDEKVTSEALEVLHP